MIRWLVTGKLKQFARVNGLLWRQAQGIQTNKGDEEDPVVAEQVAEEAEEDGTSQISSEEQQQNFKKDEDYEPIDDEIDTIEKKQGITTRLAPAYLRILASPIENWSILNESYLHLPKQQLHNAVRQRLAEMQAKHPLDLQSMLKVKKYSRKNIVNRMKNTWQRAIKGSTLSLVTIAQAVHSMISNKCYQNILTNENAYVVLTNIYENSYLERILMMRDAEFISYHLKEGIVASILQKISSGKLPIKYLRLLRYEINIRNSHRNSKNLMFISTATIKKVLVLNLEGVMSKLQLKYYLMFLAEGTYRNIFVFQDFLFDLQKLSNGHKDFKQSMQHILYSMYQGNKTIGYLLADVFFTSPTFRQAVTNIIDLLRVLEKVAINSKSAQGLFKAFESDSRMWEETWKNKVPNCIKSFDGGYLSVYSGLFKNRREQIVEQQGRFNKAVIDGGPILIGGQVPFSIEPYIFQEQVLKPKANSPFKKQNVQQKFLSKSSETIIDSVLNSDYVNLLRMVEEKLLQAPVHVWFEYEDLKKEIASSEQYRQLGGKTPAQQQNRQAMYILAQTTAFMLKQSRPIIMRDVLEGENDKFDGDQEDIEIQKMKRFNAKLQQISQRDEQMGELDEFMEEESGKEQSQDDQGVDQELGQLIEQESSPSRIVQKSLAAFSTSKPRFQFSTSKPDTEKSNEDMDGLASYLQKLRDIDQSVLEDQTQKTQKAVLKKLQQAPQKVKTQSVPATQETKFDESKLSTVIQDMLKKINSSLSFKEACQFLFAIIQKNQRPNLFEQIINLRVVKYFKTGENLLVGTFLYGLRNNAPSTPSAKLEVNFQSQSGAIEKDYNKYLDVSKSIINFQLSSLSYIFIIKSIAKDFSRLHFKRTLSHIIEHCRTIDYDLMKQICSLANRQKTAFTLLEFMQLILKNNIEISTKSFSLVADILSQYKTINYDVPSLYRDFCIQYKWNMEPSVIESYFANIIKSRNSQKLSEAIQLFKTFVEPKKYKMKDNLTPVENAKLQAEHKALAVKLNSQMSYSLATVLSRNGETEQSQILLDEYRDSKKTPLTDEELAIAYLCYSNNVDKFKTLVEMQHHRPIVSEQMENVIRALEMRGKVLANEMENVFNLFIFQRNYLLSQTEIWQLLRCVRKNENTQVFSRIVEHLVRTQPPISPALKQNLYKYLTVSKDDNGKQYSKNLLSILFDRETLDERRKIKKEWDAEQEKKRKLAEITAEARKKMEEKRRAEEQEEEELLTKHGIQKNATQKEIKTQSVKKGGKPEKQSKEEMFNKLKQERGKETPKKTEEKSKITSEDADAAYRMVLENNNILEAKLSATPRKESRVKDKAQQKAKSQTKGKSSKKEDASKAVEPAGKGKSEKKDDKKAENKNKEQKKQDQTVTSPTSTSSPKREVHNSNHLVELTDKKKVSSKMLRRGGRNKFFEMSFTDEQVEEEEAAKSKRRGK